MTDIPDWAFEEADKHFIPVQTEVSVEAVRKVIARAIMAATERAALIAEAEPEFPEPRSGETMTETDLEVARIACRMTKEAIAAAIRQGSQPSNAIPHEGTVR